MSSATHTPSDANRSSESSQSLHTNTHQVLSASTITGDEVLNRKDDKLGSIQDLMLDSQTGQIRYVVLSSGGFLGMGDRLFAVPWKALQLDAANKCFILDVDAERLKGAPGFDKDQWPNMADSKWANDVDSYYGSTSGSQRM